MSTEMVAYKYLIFFTQAVEVPNILCGQEGTSNTRLGLG